MNEVKIDVTQMKIGVPQLYRLGAEQHILVVLRYPCGHVQLREYKWNDTLERFLLLGDEGDNSVKWPIT